MDFLKRIEKESVGAQDRPERPIVIVDCGVVWHIIQKNNENSEYELVLEAIELFLTDEQIVIQQLEKFFF